MDTSQQQQQHTNDVPEFLNDLIPFRCPKCGNTRRFATLRELRQHLQRDHSYQMGVSKPHNRARVFDSTPNVNRFDNTSSPRVLMNTPPVWMQTQTRLENDYIFGTHQSSHDRLTNTPSTKFEINKVNNERQHERELSPLLQSFKDETSKLERELLKAKQEEMHNKAKAMQNLSHADINVDFKSQLENIHTNFEPKTKKKQPPLQSVLVNEDIRLNVSTFPDNNTSHKTRFQGSGAYVNLTQNPLFIPSSNTSTNFNIPNVSLKIPQLSLDNNFSHVGNTKETPLIGDQTSSTPVGSLNAEVMRSRLGHWVTSDALYETQDLLRHMEEEADNKCQQQRDIIEQLVQDMRTKDVHLQSSMQEHAQLKEERERLLSESEWLMRQAGESNASVKHELQAREKALAGVNRELGKLKELSEKEIKSKENDVLKAREKVIRLEYERDQLIQETEKLLHKADEDSSQLRQTVKEKEDELNKVNTALKQIRSDQESMLEKTMSVYRNAEEGRHVMKVAMETKEDQLQHAIRQIETMGTLHDRLVEQSRILTDQADENTASMQRLLNVKIDQIEDLMKQLETLKNEKRQLEESSSSLAVKAEHSVSAVDNLREMVKSKEKDLQTTQSELHDLKSFLQNAADKERAARNKLETFIEDLISRAERAEEELHALKSQSSSSMRTKSDIMNLNGRIGSEEVTLQTINNQSKAMISTKATHKSDQSTDLTKLENSERQNLPTRITPIKPKRMNRPANAQQHGIHRPVKAQQHDIPAWRSKIPTLKQFKALEIEQHNDPTKIIVLADVHAIPNTQQKFFRKTPVRNVARAKLKLSKESQAYDSYLPHASGPSRNYVEDPDTVHEDAHYDMSASMSDEEMNPTIMNKRTYRTHRDRSILYRKGKGRTRSPYKQNKYEDKAGDFSKHSTNDSENWSDSEYYKYNIQHAKLYSNNVKDDLSRNDTYGNNKDSYWYRTRHVKPDKNNHKTKYGQTTVYDSRRDTENDYTFNKINSPKAAKERRPTSVGLSHDAPESVSHVVKRKQKRTKRSKLREFDPTYPTSHKSMTDVRTNNEDDNQKWRHEVNRGDRRSRSLSPDVIISNKVGPQRYTRDTTTLEDKGTPETGLPYNNLIVGEENEERSDADLNRLMDENGIMWDDQDDTLPDVSDTELDRVSPSGSEAIATKNTSVTVVKHHPPSQSFPSTAIIHANNVKTTADNITKRIENMPIQINNEGHLPTVRNSTTFGKQDIDLQMPSIKDSTVPQHSTTSNEIQSNDLMLTSKRKDNVISKTSLFRPINTPLGNKSSISDKDLSSGGKEVHKYMSVSPDIDIHGSNGTHNYSADWSSTESSEASKLKFKTERKETLDVTVQRISDKYRRNRNDRTSNAQSCNSDRDVSDKIQSITYKYKQRRDQILRKEGIQEDTLKANTGTLSANMNMQTSTRPYEDVLSPREYSRTHVSPMYHNVPRHSYGYPVNYPHPPFPFTSGYPPNYQSRMPSKQPFPYGFASEISPAATYIQQQINEPVGQNLQYNDNESLRCPPEISHPDCSTECPSEHITVKSDVLSSDQNSTIKENKETHQATTALSENVDSFAVHPFHDKQADVAISDISSTVGHTVQTMVESDIDTEQVPSPIDDTNQTTTHCTATDPVLLDRHRHKDQCTSLNDPSSGSNNPSHGFVVQSPGLHYQSPGYIDQLPGTYDILRSSSDQSMSTRTNMLNINVTQNKDHTQDFQNQDRIDDQYPSDEGYEVLVKTDSGSNYHNEGLHSGARSLNHELHEYLDLSLQTKDNVVTNTFSVNSMRHSNTSNTGSPYSINTTDQGPKHQPISLFEDVDNSKTDSLTITEPLTSAFAVEIDDMSAGYDTNTISYIDLPGGTDCLTDTDLDTDTEVVRRQFYKGTEQIKSMLENDAVDTDSYSEVYKYNQARNTTSSASSQASFEILEREPANRREETRRRRAVLACIFSYLDIVTLCHVSHVCREWRLVCRSPKLWTIVKLDGVKISEYFLKYLAKRCSRLKILILKDLRPRDLYVHEDIEEFNKNIRSKLERAFEQVLKKAESTIHTISIINCGLLLSAKCLWIASCCCRMLRHVTYLSQCDPINTEVMWALGSGCRDLQTLRVHPLLPNPKAELFSTRCVQMIGQCFQDLTALSIGGKHVDLSALTFVVKRCQKLQLLELHDMNFVTCQLVDSYCHVGLHVLTHLYLLGTPAAPGAVLLLQENCPHLQTVEIRLKQCDHVTEGVVAMPDYHELVEGFQELARHESLKSILQLDLELPDPKQEPDHKEEKSFFQKLFG